MTNTIKLLFFNPDVIRADSLEFLGDFFILIIPEEGLEKSYIVDTGIMVKEKLDE